MAYRYTHLPSVFISAARSLIFSVAFAVKQAIADLKSIFRVLELDL